MGCMMARIRTIKPEFWTSAQLLECSTNARLLFIGLWNFSDDSGRHPDNAKQVKAEIFPADDFSLKEIQGMLDELSKNDLIRRYTVDSKGFFTITGWHHQRIDKPQPAKYPGPDQADSESDLGTFPPDRKGEEGKGEDIAPKGANGKDVLWEAMLKGCGIPLTAKPTGSERGAWNKALKDLRGAGATEQDIVRRCQAYRKLWPAVSLTPTALARRWNECVSDRGDTKTMPEGKCF